MSEKFLDRLSRFTPDAGGLDRDALLFKAGRESARPNRGWITAASLLACGQALSLMLLWPRPTPPAGLPDVVIVEHDRSPVIEAPLSDPAGEAHLWSVRHTLQDAESENLPSGDITFIENGPPLRAFARPSSLLN